MEMEMEFLRKLPTPQELKEQFPVSTEVVAVKAQRDEEIRNIFEGKDDRYVKNCCIRGNRKRSSTG